MDARKSKKQLFLKYLLALHNAAKALPMIFWREHILVNILKMYFTPHSQFGKSASDKNLNLSLEICLNFRDHFGYGSKQNTKNKVTVTKLGLNFAQRLPFRVDICLIYCDVPQLITKRFAGVDAKKSKWMQKSPGPYW